MGTRGLLRGVTGLGGHLTHYGRHSLSGAVVSCPVSSHPLPIPVPPPTFSFYDYVQGSSVWQTIVVVYGRPDDETRTISMGVTPVIPFLGPLEIRCTLLSTP